jgi:hypothetical protein
MCVRTLHGTASAARALSLGTPFLTTGLLHARRRRLPHRSVCRRQAQGRQAQGAHVTRAGPDAATGGAEQEAHGVEAHVTRAGRGRRRRGRRRRGTRRPAPANQREPSAQGTPMPPPAGCRSLTEQHHHHRCVMASLCSVHAALTPQTNKPPGQPVHAARTPQTMRLAMPPPAGTQPGPPGRACVSPAYACMRRNLCPLRQRNSKWIPSPAPDACARPDR